MAIIPLKTIIDVDYLKVWIIGCCEISDVKGVVEVIIEELRLAQISYDLQIKPAHYVRDKQHVTILCKDNKIGSFGNIKADVLKGFGVKQDVYYLEMNLELVNAIKPDPRLFKPLSRFPSVKWDVAIVVSDDVGAGDMIEAVTNSKFSIVSNAEIFDVYRGKPIDAGFKSVALSITYHSDEQTLDDDTVGKVHKQLIDLLVNKFNGQLREV